MNGIAALGRGYLCGVHAMADMFLSYSGLELPRTICGLDTGTEAALGGLAWPTLGDGDFNK